MIRGSIEVAKRTQVSGWIHAEAGPVHGRLILAFAGDRCVGAGRVDRFRKDLLEAKLGDGYCGFDFPIKLNDAEKLGAVVVKLQNSDLALLQNCTQLIGPEDGAPGGSEPPDLGAVPPGCIPWMQDRGWLEQQDCNFLKAVHTIGAYELGLRAPRRGGSLSSAVVDPERAAQAHFSVYAMSDVDLTITRVPGISQLSDENASMAAAGLSVIALWSAGHCRVALEERSHIAPLDAHVPAQARTARNITVSPAPGAIDYSFGPDRLLFLHRHASFAPEGMAPPDGIVLFTAAKRSVIPAANAGRRRAIIAA